MSLSKVCFIVLLFAPFHMTSNFRGGTISWSATGEPNEVEFTFKLGWAFGAGPGCDETMIGKYVNGLSKHNAWYCRQGCGPSKVWLSSVNYICTAASTVQNWEQGQNSFKFTFPNKGPFTVEFTGNAWISLDFGVGGYWNISTVVDLRNRNDTGRPNMSPVSSAKPIYSLKYGCTKTIKLPVMDQDGDKVTCRWSKGEECASVCEALPNATIDPDTCSLTVVAKHRPNGTYAVAITIEDSPRQVISLNDSVYMENDVISSVPMQFLIDTPDEPSRSCSDKPIFVTPTPLEGKLYILKPTEKLSISFYATSKGTSITSFELTAPPGVMKSSIQSVPERLDVYKMTVTWTPNMENKGQHALCAEATDSFAISSDTHCLNVVAWDISVCESDPCLNNATCFDLINEFFCGCAPGFTGIQCQTDINECDEMMCLNGGTCEDLVGKGVCHCLPSFTGTLCQTGFDYCTSRPCLNDGKCSSYISGYSCSCVNDWHGINCAFRDKPFNNTEAAVLMANEHMLYSDCKCLFGNERRQFCYPYNQNKGIGFGVLGTVLGSATSVLLYILFEGVFGKRLFCFREAFINTPARPRLNTSAYPDIFKRFNETYNSINEGDDCKLDEKNCGQITNNFLKRGTFQGRHCWACREIAERANHAAPTPTHEFLKKYSGMKKVFQK